MKRSYCSPALEISFVACEEIMFLAASNEASEADMINSIWDIWEF